MSVEVRGGRCRCRTVETYSSESMRLLTLLKVRFASSVNALSILALLLEMDRCVSVEYVIVDDRLTFCCFLSWL